MPRCWYLFKTTGSDPTLPGNFLVLGSVPACITGFTICAIYAPDCGPNPSVISQNLQNYMARGLAFGTAQPSNPVGSRIFVRMKP